MTNYEETIGAFLDGEAVDVNELRTALADAPARDYLVDVLALRGLVGDPAITTPGLKARPANNPGSGRPNVGWLSAVAALIIVGTTAGFFAGQRMTPTRSDQLTPSPVATVQANPVLPLLIAPSPTRVIHLQNGKDWNERSGGN